MSNASEQSCPDTSHIAYVGLGSDLGEREAQVRAALVALGELPATRLLRASSLYRSEPIGCVGQAEFINAVAELQSALSARALLEALLELEARFGRRRSVVNAPRTLDLDLLLYGDAVIDEPGLTVPHPRMHERRFVLEPLVEIAPHCLIAGRGAARDWLARVQDQVVRRL